MTPKHLGGAHVGSNEICPSKSSYSIGPSIIVTIEDGGGG